MHWWRTAHSSRRRVTDHLHHLLRMHRISPGRIHHIGTRPLGLIVLLVRHHHDHLRSGWLLSNRKHHSVSICIDSWLHHYQPPGSRHHALRSHLLLLRRETAVHTTGGSIIAWVGRRFPTRLRSTLLLLLLLLLLRL